MKTKRKWQFFLILLMIPLMILSACSNESASNNKGESKKGETQGVTDKEVIIGHIGPQTGPVAVYDYVRKGLDAHIKYVNENGGVHGRTIKLLAYDDGYQPSKTIQQANRLIEQDKVFAMVGNVGTSTNNAIKERLEKSGVISFMVGTGATSLVDPPTKNFYGSNVPNYQIEARILYEYIVNELKATKIGAVYQNDDYGDEVMSVFRENAEKDDDVELVVEVPYPVGEADMSSYAQQISKADPDVILSMAGPNQSANLKKELYKIGVKDKPFFVPNAAGSDKNLFNLAGKEVWEGTISPASFPMADVSDDEKLKIYVEQFKKYYPNDPAEGFAQLGWAAGQVFVEALNRAGEDLTKESFAEAVYTFDNWDGSIYSGVTFSENNHYGLTSMFLTMAKDGKIVPLEGTYHFNPETDEITFEK